MQSVFKLPIAIEVLRQVDAKKLDLARVVALGPSDRRDGPPGTMAVPAKKTIRELLEAMLTTERQRRLRQAAGAGRRPRRGRRARAGARHRARDDPLHGARSPHGQGRQHRHARGHGGVAGEDRAARRRAVGGERERCWRTCSCGWRRARSASRARCRPGRPSRTRPACPTRETARPTPPTTSV